VYQNHFKYDDFLIHISAVGDVVAGSEGGLPGCAYSAHFSSVLFNYGPEKASLIF
jgi:hypothetical protein